MRRHIPHGDLPAHRCGRLIRVDQDDVYRMMVRIPTARGMSPAVGRGAARGGLGSCLLSPAVAALNPQSRADGQHRGPQNGPQNSV